MTNAWTSTRCGALLLGLASASLMAQEQPAAPDAPAEAAPKVQGTELKAVEIRANRETGRPVRINEDLRAKLIDIRIAS